MATELKVNDLQIACLSDMADKWDDIDSVLAEYFIILADVRDNAVKEGSIHHTIDFFYHYAKSVYDGMKSSGSLSAVLAEKFLDKIEATDLNLYNGV